MSLFLPCICKFRYMSAEISRNLFHICSCMMKHTASKFFIVSFTGKHNFPVFFVFLFYDTDLILHSCGNSLGKLIP